MSIGSLTIDLMMKTGSFETDTKRAAKIAQKRAKEIDEAFAKAGKAIGVALAAGVTAAGYAFKTTVDRMDELSKAAARASMPTEDFSRLAYAADLADVSMQDLQGAMGKLAKAQGDASRGSKEQADAFDRLGISYKNADGSLRRTSDVFLDFADRFQKFKGSPEIVALGMQTFGRSFQNLIPLLNDGAQGLKDAGAEADAFGVTVSTKVGKQAESFNDNITRLTKTIEGLKIELFSGLIPQLDNLLGRYIALSRLGKGPIDLIEGMFGEGPEKKIEGYERRIADLMRIREQLAKQGDPSWWQRQMNPSLRTKDSIDQELIELAGKLEEARQFRRLLSPPDLSGLNVPQSGNLPSSPSRAGKASGADPLSSVLDAAILRDFDRMQTAREQAEEFEGFLAQLVGEDEMRLREQASAWRDLIDPTRAFTRQLEEIRALVDAGALSAAEGIAAEFDVQSRMNDALLGGLAGDIRESNDAARELGLTFSSAFEDAIIGGKGLREVLGGIGQDLLRMTIRKSVTEPAANWLAGSIGSIFGGARADGGPVSAGSAYLVGERGPELFTPKTSGSITPNHAMGGVNVTNHYRFESGTNVAQLQAFAEQIKADTKADIIDGMRRGRYVTA